MENWREKSLKLVVGINNLSAVHQPAYSNHLQFFFRLGRSYPNIEVLLVNPARMSIDRMRNMAAEQSLRWEADYLLFLDDDVIVPFTGLANLLDADRDIVAGDVLIRGYPFEHMIFDYTEDKKKMLPIRTPEEPLGVYDCDAVGFSFCLIKTAVLNKCPKPYFVTGPRNTEDIYFCIKSRLADPSISIACDTRVKCGHILNPYPVSPDNVENFREYYEKQYPQAIEDQNKDRGQDYYEIVQGGKPNGKAELGVRQ
jgi:hypothetical protein